MAASINSEGDSARATARRRIQFSIGGLLLTVAGVSLVFSAYFTYGALGASGVVLALGVALIIVGSRAKDRFRNCLGWALAVVGLLAGGVAYAAWVLFDVGPIYSQSDWPPALQRMTEIAAP